MRLKLNRTLRAALIAAITAAGFTLSQAQAEQLLTLQSTEKMSVNDGKGTLTAGNSGINWTNAGIGNLTSWQLTFDLKETQSLGDHALFGSNNSSTCAGDTLFTTGSGAVKLTAGGSNISSADNLIVQGQNVAVILRYVADYDEDGASLNKGTYTLTVGSGQAVTLNVANDGNTTFIKNGASRLWTNGGMEQFYNITLTQLDNNVVTIPTSTWKGTRESHDWSGSVWDTGTYKDGNKAVFGAEGYNEVTVSAATTAASVSVSEQEYTFEITAGGSLTAAKANIAESESLTVKGTEANAGTVTITSLSGAGNLIVGENGTATVNGLNSYTGTMSVEDGGTLNLGSSITLDSLTVADGTVTTQHNAASGVVANTLSIGEGGTFKVIGGHDAFGYNAGATKEIVMEGSEEHHATLALEQNTTNSATMTTNIVMHGYSDITVKDGGKGFNTYGGNITVDGEKNTIAVIDLRNAVTIDVAEEGELSVSKFTVNGTSTAAVTKTGGGIMTITEASTLPGALNINGGTVSIGADTTIAGLNIATTGSLTVTNGSTTVRGNTNVIGNTISVTGGTLTLTGSYAIDSITGGDLHEDFVDDHGETATSGFSRKSGSVTVYSQDGGTVDATGATFTLGGRQVTATDGVVTIDTTIDYTTLYVNDMSAPVDFAAHQAYAQSQQSGITGVVLKDMAAVENVSGTVGVTLAEGTDVATVSASGATTLSSISGWSNNSLVIEGSGEVTMAGQTLTGSQGLYVMGTVSTTGALTVNGEGAFLYVEEDATLNINGNANLTPVHGSVEIFGEVNISHELDLSNGSTAEGTVSVGSTGKLSVWGMWMHNDVSVDLEEGGEFSIGHNAVKDLTIIGKEDGGSITYNNAARDANYGTNNADFTITNATVTATKNVTIGNTLENVDVVVADGGSATLNTAADSVTVEDGGTFAMGTSGVVADTITIEEGGTLLVNSELDLGDQLNSSGNIVVGTAGSLTLTEGSTIGAVIQNSGSVTLTGLTLDDSVFTETEGGDAHFGLNGQETEEDNYFEGTSASYVQVVDGGTSSGSELTWGELSDQTLTDGKIITVEADIDYDTFYVGGEISTSDINASAHADAIENIEVGNGATLTVNETVSAATIHAGDGATVAGEKAQDTVQIRAGETVDYADGIKVSHNGSAVFSGDVQVTNDSDSDNAFSMSNRDMVLRAETLAYGDGALDTLQIVCGVDVDNVINESGQELILNTLVASELDGVSALSGDIVLVSTQGDLTINNLEIQAGQAVQAVEIVSGQTPEVTVTVTETLTAGGNATLLANLEMANDSALLLNGAGENALVLGSTLDLGTGIKLDAITLQALDAMSLGETLMLVKAADDTDFTYLGEAEWFGQVFSRSASEGGYDLIGDYSVLADADGFGLVKVSNTPEPTTGTLSLLALCALAARRRRK